MAIDPRDDVWLLLGLGVLAALISIAVSLLR